MTEFLISQDELQIAVPQIVYLDFAGDLIPGSAESSNNGSRDGSCTVFTAEYIPSLLAELNALYAEKNIEFVAEEPAEGEYSTIYVGTSLGGSNDDCSVVVLAPAASKEEIVAAIGSAADKRLETAAQADLPQNSITMRATAADEPLAVQCQAAEESGAVWFVGGTVGSVYNGITLTTDNCFATYDALAEADVVDDTSQVIYLNPSINKTLGMRGRITDTTLAGSMTMTVQADSNNVIDAGTVSGVIAGGEILQFTMGWYKRTGNITTTIDGGTFHKAVYGGMYKNNAAPMVFGSLTGNINMTVNGSTSGTVFHELFYAGHGLHTENVVGLTIQGNINLVLDSSDGAITFNKAMAAGSLGACSLAGNINVTITGSNAISMKQLWGANTSGFYRGDYVEGAVMESHSVTGTRNLLFTDFTGDFTFTSIVGFQKVQFENSILDFKGAGLGMHEEDEWLMDADSQLLNFNKHDFSGDTLEIDLTGWEGNTGNGHLLLSGNSVDSLANLTSLTIGGTNAVFADNVWTAGDYTLTIDTENDEARLAGPSTLA